MSGFTAKTRKQVIESEAAQETDQETYKELAKSIQVRQGMVAAGREMIQIKYSHRLALNLLNCVEDSQTRKRKRNNVSAGSHSNGRQRD